MIDSHALNVVRPESFGSKMTKVLGSYDASTSEPLSYCPGPGCAEKVPERVLVCRECVALIPDKLLDAYYATFVRGQNALTQSAANKAAYAAVTEFCSRLAVTA